jgi:NAD(P)-dependent dehydrogenase (short-subunit alcohol dehydrogenase family)
VPADDLTGQIALVTGGGRGIGASIARELADAGMKVAVSSRTREEVEAVADEIGAAGGTVSYHAPADVSDHGAVTTMAREIHAAHGSLDLVINVAGISTWGSIENLEHAHWRRQVDVNLMGPINVLSGFVPAMIEAGRGGHVVNVSSAAGLFGLPWHAAYSAAKFGLRGVSEVLRFDLRRHGIGVTLVCPGAVDTPLVDSVQIVGVDRSRAPIQALTQHFRARAVTPERAAAAILDGVRKGRYLVFTSNDIRALYWSQRLAPPLYERVMRRLNDRLAAVARGSHRS